MPLNGMIYDDDDDDLGGAEEVSLRVGGARLDSDLYLRAGGLALVILADGDARTRRRPRNMTLARAFRAAGMAALTVDLLTPEEDGTEDAEALRTDVDLLAARLGAIVDAASVDPATSHLPIGIFASGPAAAAALLVASERPGLVRAVASYGGRLDLAGDWLSDVLAPTVLIDESTGEELQQVAELAIGWFTLQLNKSRPVHFLA